MTETMTKRRMMAELIFQNPHDAKTATISISGLAKYGVTTRVLDWSDPGGTSTVWVLAFIDYEGNQDDFFRWIRGRADEFGGDVVEASLAPDDVEAWIASKS